MGTLLAIIAIVVGGGLIAGATRGRPVDDPDDQPPRSLRVLHAGVCAPHALVTRLARAGFAIGRNPSLLWLVAGAGLAVALAPLEVLSGLGLLVAGWYAAVLSAYGYLSLAEHLLRSARSTEAARPRTAAR